MFSGHSLPRRSSNRCRFRARRTGIILAPVPTLLHFTAKWAEGVCSPHRPVVAAAAQELGWAVREVDIDSEPETARTYTVLNVPAIATEGDVSAPPLVGARPADAIVRHFRNSE